MELCQDGPQIQIEEPMEERLRDIVRSKTSDEGLTSRFGTLEQGAGLRKLLFKVGPLRVRSMLRG